MQDGASILWAMKTTSMLIPEVLDAISAKTCVKVQRFLKVLDGISKIHPHGNSSAGRDSALKREQNTGDSASAASSANAADTVQGLQKGPQAVRSDTVNLIKMFQSDALSKAVAEALMSVTDADGHSGDDVDDAMS